MDYEQIRNFESIKFEDYSIVGAYAAILSKTENTIEAIITAPNISKIGTTRLKKFLLQGRSEYKFTQDFDETKFHISIANSSKEIRTITDQSDGLGLSLKIACKDTVNHEKALVLLTEVSNSLFFDMDIENNIFLTLARYSSRRKRDSLSRDAKITEYPKNKYDNSSMELYWYARSAINMPLLQFLAYYQAIEFYYPNFFNVELTKKIRAIIKNPSFRIAKDSDVSKILSAIKDKGSHFGAEREQLKSTLKECLDNEEIAKFVSASTEREKFFNSKAKGITSKTINVQNKNIDLYIQVAERIYDIRCKIVHTKGDDSDGEIELLLPFSKEAEKLDEDIELVKFVAQKIIIHTSGNLLE